MGGGSDIMGKKKKPGRARWGQVGLIYSDEVPRSSEVGAGVRDGEDLGG